MTVLSGEVYKAEGAEGIITKLNIKPDELFQALTENEEGLVVEQFNKVCDDYECESIEEIDQLPEFVYDEWREWLNFANYEQLALRVLERREQDYIHVSEPSMFGTFHTVVEVKRQ